MSENENKLGKNIKLMRERMGLSQYALAEKAGMSQKGLSEIELGKRQPRASNLNAIASALGCTAPDLYAGPDQPRPEPKRRLFDFTEDELKELIAGVIEKRLGVKYVRPETEKPTNEKIDHLCNLIRKLSDSKINTLTPIVERLIGQGDDKHKSRPS